jgi:hypothetical protein
VPAHWRGKLFNVADFCNCGAQLVEDALFCHKCGRPVREIPNLREAGEHDQAVPSGQDLRAAAQLPPAEIGFGNMQAVSVAMTISGLAMLLSLFAPLPPLLQFFWRLFVLLVAGFVAVYVYHRRTGQFLTPRSGARMGWLTGLFCFLIALVISVAGVFAVSANRGGLAAVWRSQLEQYASGGAEVEQAIRILESPWGLASVLLLVIGILFVISTVLPMIGGALGAKVLEKED